MLKSGFNHSVSMLRRERLRDCRSVSWDVVKSEVLFIGDYFIRGGAEESFNNCLKFIDLFGQVSKIVAKVANSTEGSRNEAFSSISTLFPETLVEFF